ncbi:MAG: DNA polymerase III subunit epsilon [Lysobacterales bacterium]|nr:MAG: DNA polymerase III subunit epsilon [Xanthomonadales bacterium]
MRQIILDTETTGLEPADGHRVIEIGCVELVDRRLSGQHFHQYLNPERDIEDGALEVHGISREFLADKPVFADVVEEFLAFIEGAELIIHNAPFDLNFLDAELALLGRTDRMGDHVAVTDTLELARELHPGQRNSLDALCKRYEIDDSSRALHGALLDAEILADVYLAMTGGQSDLGLSFDAPAGAAPEPGNPLRGARPPLKVLLPSATEIAAHEARLHAIHEKVGHCLWYEL